MFNINLDHQSEIRNLRNADQYKHIYTQQTVYVHRALRTIDPWRPMSMGPVRLVRRCISSVGEDFQAKKRLKRVQSDRAYEDAVYHAQIQDDQYGVLWNEFEFTDEIPQLSSSGCVHLRSLRLRSH